MQTLTTHFDSATIPFINGGEGLCMLGRIYQKRSNRYFIQLRTNRENVYCDRLGNPFVSYQHAERSLTKIRVEIDEGSFDITRYVAHKIKPLRFSNWSNAWLERKKKEVEKGLRSPSYLKTVRVYLYKYQPYFKDKDIREIRTKDIEDFILSLSGSPKYLKNMRDCLSKMFNDAFNWEDIKNMPKFPKIDLNEVETKIIDLETQDKIINTIPDPMDRSYILFCAREMVRPSETRALWWDDIDLKYDKVTIKRHFSLNVLRPATKARQIKTLPLDGEVKKSLLSLPRHITSPFVFYKKNGNPFSESWARKIWKRTSLTLGVNISLYQGTRHSSATEAANRVGLDATQEFLGHTNRAMTKRYAQVNVEAKRKVLR